MPKTREQHELTTVRCGLRTYECPTIHDCERLIQQLTDQIHNPGAGTPDAIRIWREDRDAILDRLSWLIVKAEQSPQDPCYPNRPASLNQP